MTSECNYKLNDDEIKRNKIFVNKLGMWQFDTEINVIKYEIYINMKLNRNMHTNMQASINKLKFQ